jgi:hypothetical protein
MVLQTQECPDRQPDVVALRPGGPDLSPFHTAALLQAPVIVLDPPALLGVGQSGQLIHLQVVRRPVFNVPVSGDDLEDADRPEPLQMDDRPPRSDRHLGDGPVSLAIEIHLPVDLQLRQEGPTADSDRLEVLQGRVPAVKGHAPWLEAAGLGLVEHRPEVVVLGQAVLALVVEPVVAGDDPVAIGPDQGDQVDAPDDPLVLTRPVAADQVDLLGVVLVQSRVVEDEQAPLAVDHRAGLVPERGGVGLQPMQEPGEGVVGRRVGRFRLHRGGLRTAERSGRGDEEIDVVGVATFGLGGVHSAHHAGPSHSAQHGQPATTA